MSGALKQINDKVEILESKTEAMNRELERELDDLALMKLKRRNFVWDVEQFQEIVVIYCRKVASKFWIGIMRIQKQKLIRYIKYIQILCE